MKILICVGVVFVFVLMGLFLIRRKRRRRFVLTTQNHPAGYIKYHLNTKVVVKKAIDPEAPDEPPCVAVLKFKGDLHASERESLSRLIDEVILNKERFDEVVMRVESGGGSVAEYGHAYAEVSRVRESGLKLTVCVDTVAASGGYLMCLPAHQILAAPFAMVGSIGVVSFVPNIRKLLERFNIEPRTFTAGAYKRTVTLTDEASPEEVDRFRQSLNLIHDQFKQALLRFRPHVELSQVATGEAWLAATSQEKKMGIVDGLRSSSDYLLEKNRLKNLVYFSEPAKKIGVLRRFFRVFSSEELSLCDLGSAVRSLLG